MEFFIPSRSWFGLELALLDFPDEEALGHGRRTGLVLFLQPSPDFHSDLPHTFCLFLRQQDPAPTHGLYPIELY